MHRPFKVGLALLLLAACAGGQPRPDITQTEGGTIYYEQITLPNGQVVSCMVLDDGYSGGISCDWGDR